MMRPIYLKQEKFFREAYESGEHGWPVEGPTPHVARLVARLGSGRAEGEFEYDTVRVREVNGLTSAMVFNPIRDR